MLVLMESHTVPLIIAGLTLALFLIGLAVVMFTGSSRPHS